MKKLKKFLAIVLMVVFSISSFSSVSASSLKPSESDGEIIFEASEIKDLSKLRERAKSGVTDKKGKVFSSTVDNEEQLAELGETDSYETTQKLKALKKSDGTIHEYYATTVFYDIYEKETKENEKKDKKENVPFLGTVLNFINTIFVGTKVHAGSQSNSTSGASYSVRSYSTIYWENKTTNGVSYARLTRVTGGWTILDSSVSISNRKVEYGQTPLTNESDTKNPTTNTFNYYTPTDWGWENDGSYIAIGATTYVTIKRGTSSWVQKLQNMYN